MVIISQNNLLLDNYLLISKKTEDTVIIKHKVEDIKNDEEKKMEKRKQ